MKAEDPVGRPDVIVIGASAGGVEALAPDSGPVAQLVVDHGGFLAAVNAQGRTLFGISQRDLGRPLQDLELSYKPLELRSRIEEAEKARHPVVIRDIEWPFGDDMRWFDVQICPLHAADGASVGIGIAFVDTSRYRGLQDSLEQSKEHLETAYEELQSTAEELETTNEELQSTNEELETMNEELQSTNEELHTMNDEMRQTSEELSQVNSFLESILGSIHAGVVVTGRELRVQAWNDEATELWGLRADEVHGQHLVNLDIGLPLERVTPLLRAALSDSSVQEEVLAATNRRGQAIECLVRASPLLSADRELRGLIVLMEAR
jgi:two-component system CheB/CheR fusion protein